MAAGKVEIYGTSICRSKAHEADNVCHSSLQQRCTKRNGMKPLILSVLDIAAQVSAAGDFSEAPGALVEDVGGRGLGKEED